MYYYCILYCKNFKITQKNPVSWEHHKYKSSGWFMVYGFQILGLNTLNHNAQVRLTLDHFGTDDF